MPYGLEDKIFDLLRELDLLLTQAKADQRNPTVGTSGDSSSGDSRPCIQLRDPPWWSDGREIQKSVH